MKALSCVKTFVLKTVTVHQGEFHITLNSPANS